MNNSCEQDHPGQHVAAHIAREDERFLAQLHAMQGTDFSSESRLRHTLRAHLANPATRPVVAGPWPARRTWLGGMVVALALMLALTLHPLDAGAARFGASTYNATAKVSGSVMAEPGVSKMTNPAASMADNRPQPQPTPLPPGQKIIKAPVQSPAPQPEFAPVTIPAPKP